MAPDTSVFQKDAKIAREEKQKKIESGRKGVDMKIYGGG
tara:strand:+ start:588 stop:704 length:117 start_codon:yes stop_codon:yes gene_type:complete